MERMEAAFVGGSRPARPSWAWFAPVLLTLAYPFLLAAFSNAIATGDGPADAARASAGWLALVAATSVPLVGLGWAYRLRGVSDPADLRVRARLLAYLTMAAPALFTFIGVVRGLVGRPLTDQSVWLGVWLLAIGAACLPRRGTHARIQAGEASVRLRVAHGIAASIIVLFVAFHLANHLSGLIGPATHAAIMAAGRKVYRLLPVEMLLVGLLLFQVASGATLAARWSRRAGDGFRVLQIGSGIYVGSFVVTHLNSALVSARAVRHIDTDWAWASGGTEGLLHDAWNIRLVPHYGYGAFFILTHLLLGLRQVLMAHGFEPRLVNRLWAGAMIGATVAAAAIMAALLGLRLQ